jgi:hypothetical protein
MKRPFFECALVAVAVAMCGCRSVGGPYRPMPWPSEVAGAAQGKDLETLRHLISQSVERYEGIRDYRCVFQKRQRVGGSLQDQQRIVLKFRKPMNVYMRWLTKAHEGQEILYAPSRYGRKALAHPGGWKGTLMPAIPIDVDGYWVMRDNIHPINHVGIGHFLGVFAENSQRARAEKASALIDRGEERVGARPARVIEAVLPPEREKGYYCYRCLVWFDEESLLPVKIQVYDWDNNLSEEYMYENLEVDVGLTDRDFDRKNNEYNF